MKEALQRAYREEKNVVGKAQLKAILDNVELAEKTVDAMKKYGAVYGALTGGAGVLAAKAIKQVKVVEWSDLGMPEAMWILEVEDFGPLTVAIDAHGNNLFETIRNKVDEEKQEIYKKLEV